MQEAFKEVIMSGAGGAGGVGAGGGGAAAATAGGTMAGGSAVSSGGEGGSSALGAAEGANVGSADSVGNTAQELATSDPKQNLNDDIAAQAMQPHQCSNQSYINMSTQQFINIQNTSVEQYQMTPERMDQQEFDLKKLLEMMIALKLLQALSEK